MSTATAAPAQVESITSKCTVCEQGGAPFAMDPSKPEEKMHRPYDVKFADGSEGKISGLVASAPLIVGNEYTFTIGKTKSGAALIKIVQHQATTAAAKAATPATPAPVATAPAEPGPMAPVEEKVAPSLKPAAGPMAPVTQKADVIPDNVPRNGKVKIVRFSEAIVPKDDPTAKLYKYVVTMYDGAHGIAWGHEENVAPFALGQEINYTYGKVYQDGSKRIDMAAAGSTVDRETIHMRLGCLNAAVELSGHPQVFDEASIERHTERALLIAKDLEQHILRPIN